MDSLQVRTGQVSLRILDDDGEERFDRGLGNNAD